ncbi:hypothetical protein FQZ97_1276500 [compost metagenome]
MPSKACRLSKDSTGAVLRSIKSIRSLTLLSSSKMAEDSERITACPGPERRWYSCSRSWSVKGSAVMPKTSQTARARGPRLSARATR